MTLLLIGIVLMRQRARQTRATARAGSSAQAQGRAPEAGPVPVAVTAPVTASPGTEPSPPPRDAGDLGAIVLEHLRRLEARGSPGLAAQVIAIFLQDTSARLAALREAVARKDSDAVRRVAHTLHGSASMVGAASLERGCAEIITQVRSGSFDRCEAIVAELDADFEAIRRTVKA